MPEKFEDGIETNDDIDVGGNDIVDVNTVDGVDVSSHATRHEFGGGDPVDLGNLAGEITDTQHGNRGSGSLHATATSLIAGFLSAADKAAIDTFTAGGVFTINLRNESGSTISAHKLVAVTGFNTTEGLPSVDLADKDDPAKRPAVAITTAAIPNNTNFSGLVAGTITGIDTSAFSLSDQLVLGDNGDFTRPPPDNASFTGEIQYIASVSRVHATLGEIIVVVIQALDVVSGDQAFALQGTDGTPSDTNRYVTDSDPRVTPSTATPSQIDAGDSAVIGTSTTPSRDDHQHAVNTALLGDLGSQTVGAGSAGVSLALPRADHIHPMTSTAPVTIDKSANAEGVATTVARSDHKHDISTAAPTASIDAGDVAVEGTATTIARSDHQHAVSTGIAGDITQIDVGDTAAAGTSTNLARADHQHALPAPAAPADVTKATASAGVATTVARADHKHDVSTATAVSTGTANAEGTAVALSRSDHVHRTLVSVQDEGSAAGSRPTLNFIGSGVTTVDNPGSDRVDITISSTPQATADTFRWTGIGNIVTQTDLDGAWIAPRAGTISRITLHRRLAGGGGTTTVDVNKNQVTVFTTQANRPAITAASGDNQISAHTDMDVTSFAQNDQFQIDVDTAETGTARDISVVMEVQYT